MISQLKLKLFAEVKMYVLLLSVICFNFASLASAECSNREYGRFCNISGNPEAVELLDNQLFVGTESKLLVFSLPALQLLQNINLSSSAETVRQCSSIDGLGVTDVQDCNNFIRTIQPYPDGRVMVCGTNAHHPQCNIHLANSTSNYRKLSGSSEIDTGFSPFSNTHPIESILAGNGRFFSATRFDSSGKLSIRMAPGALVNDTTFNVTTRNDERWLNRPTFVSVHEYGEHVYFFLTEPALELEDKEVYSRVIRICKTDIGVTGPDHHFLTFQKARIECSANENGGSFPFIYNNLASTFFSQNDGEPPVLYGAFNSPTNGPAGGVLCKFAFDTTISNIFEDTIYLVKMNIEGRDFWDRNTAPVAAFSCPGSQTGTQREPSDVRMYQLKYKPIEQKQPLYISPKTRLDKIAAETVQYMGASQEIVYFTNQRGDIMQVVLASSQQYQHTIFQSGSPNPVRKLILHHQNTTRSLIATSNGQIIQIPRGQCSNYADCFSCFDSKDAYCGWDTTSRSCVNKFERSDLANLIQTFSASETSTTDTCGDRPPSTHPTDEPDPPCPSQNPSTSPNTVEIVTNTEEQKTEGKEDCTTGTVGGEGLEPATDRLTGAENESIGIPVGASLGAFLFGLAIGTVVCIAFSRRCTRRSKSSSKDSSPEAPRESTALPHGNEMVTMTQVNNNNQVIEKENLEYPKLQPPPPRYVQHNPVKPPTAVITVSPPTQTKKRLGSTSSLPPAYKHANGTVHPHQLPEEEADDTFADNDTVPPLRSFPSSPGAMYGSLGRNKTGMNGISRKQIPGHKLPRGRTDSTTWLRQRSESLSSDISSNTSPLESPISDV